MTRRRGDGREIVPYQGRTPTPSPLREIGRQLGWLAVRVIANRAQPKPPPPQQEAPRSRRRGRGARIRVTDTDEQTVIEINHDPGWPMWLKILAAIFVIAVGLSAANHSSDKYRNNPNVEDRVK